MFTWTLKRKQNRMLLLGLAVATALVTPLVAAPVPAQAATANWKSIAETEAYKHGVKVIWVNAAKACASIPTANVGCYVSGQGPVIRIITGISKYSADGIRDVVRHEVAHHKIALMCGTTRPPIVGSRTENVTDAYAYRYLGMKTAKAYGWNQNDLDLAGKIRDGKCYSTQKTFTTPFGGVNLYYRTDTAGKSMSKTVEQNRGTRLTYMYTQGAYAWVKDAKGNFGYISTWVTKNPNNYKTLTVYNTRVRAYELYGDGQSYTPVYKETFRILTSINSNYYLAVNRNGEGQLVSLHKENTLKPTQTFQVTKSSSQYLISNQQWKMAKYIPVGAKVNLLKSYDANFYQVTWQKQTYLIQKSTVKRVAFQGN